MQLALFNKYKIYSMTYEYICTYTYRQTPLVFNTLMWGLLRLAPTIPVWSEHVYIHPIDSFHWAWLKRLHFHVQKAINGVCMLNAGVKKCYITPGHASERYKRMLLSSERSAVPLLLNRIISLQKWLAPPIWKPVD